MLHHIKKVVISENIYLRVLTWIVVFISVFFLSYLVGIRSYLLFHCVAELFSIIIAFSIFIIAFNSREFSDSNYLMLIGIAYLFVGSLDLLHTLAYKGMNIFHTNGANLSVQLWIASRYMESISLFAAPVLFRRKINWYLVFGIYSTVFLLSIESIFYWNIFPVCYIEGKGLTGFKIVSEYVICVILGGSIVNLLKHKQEFDRNVLRLFVVSIMVTICSELTFTLYVGVYGTFNLIGHFLKIVSFYFIYKAIVEIGLRKPYNLLFKGLKESEEFLRKACAELGLKVERQDNNLSKLNALLQQEMNRRKQIAMELEESEDRFKTIFDNASDGILAVDLENKKFLMGNEMICRMLGYTLREIKKLAVSDIHPRETLPYVIGKFEKVSRSKFAVTRNIPVKRKDGSIFYADINSSRIVFNRKNYMIGIFRDVTERRDIENEVLETQRLDLMSILSAGIVHEINNPLYGIYNYLELLSGEKDKEARRKYSNMILHGLDIVKSVTNNLLDLSQINKLDLKKVSVKELLEDTLAFCMPDIQKAKVKVSVHSQNNIPDILLDRNRIKRVFLNLITNAIEAMPEGGSLEINSRYIDSKVYFSFADTGMGIVQESLKKIFEPFYSDKKKQGKRGVGLGLFMASNIVTLHRGEIKVKSVKGKGSLFEVILPASS